MIIVRHVVEPKDKPHILEPVGWVVWLLKASDGSFLALPNGTYISAVTRKLIEVILFEIVHEDPKNGYTSCLRGPLEGLTGQ